MTVRCNRILGDCDPISNFRQFLASDLDIRLRTLAPREPRPLVEPNGLLVRGQDYSPNKAKVA
jgi:hypothetical protein